MGSILTSPSKDGIDFLWKYTDKKSIDKEIFTNQVAYWQGLPDNQKYTAEWSKLWTDWDLKLNPEEVPDWFARHHPNDRYHISEPFATTIDRIRSYYSKY